MSFTDSSRGMTGFLMAAFILIITHTVLSVTIWLVFQKTITFSKPREAPLKIVNTNKVNENITIIELEKKEFQTVKTIPNVVYFYIWSGYIGILSSAIIAFISILRK